MRRLLTLRWLGLHLLALVLAGGCLALGWWQWQRGQAGNARSFAYALEWPAFAIFVLFMWGRMIYDTLRPPVVARSGAPEAGSAVESSSGGAVAAPAAGESALVDPDEDPELAAYNRYLAELNERAQRYGR